MSEQKQKNESESDNLKGQEDAGKNHFQPNRAKDKEEYKKGFIKVLKEKGVVPKGQNLF